MRTRGVGRLLSVLLMGGGIVLFAACAAGSSGGSGLDRAGSVVAGSEADTLTAEIRSPKAYEEFLGALGDPAAEGRYAPSVVRRHLDALSAVLPEDVIERFRVRKGAETGSVAALGAGAGSVLTRWWHRQDPFPATPYNERLREHLQRTTEAFERYSREDDPNRLDDRGRVYVRFGPPDRRRDIDVGHEGEFWVYASHSAAEYVFVRERGDGYLLAPPTDILPERLRRGFGPSRRGQRKAVESLTMLETVYETLAHFRSRYGITFSDLSMYREQVRQAMDGLPTSFSVRPHTFAQQKIQEIEHEEIEAAQRRAEVLPRTQTKTGNQFERLPIAARWMRTLTEAGSTEVELAWSVSRASLHPSRKRADSIDRSNGQYLLSSSLVRYSDAYERRDVRTRHLLAPSEGPDGTLDPRQMTFLLADTPHAALQVDLAWATVSADASAVQPRAKLKVGTSRADSLRPLRADPDVLEMSDLEPILWTSDTLTVAEAPPYPFRQIAPTTPLALRFEVYHLSTDAEGRTRYTVEYEVLRRTDRGNFERFLRGDEEQRTAVQSQVEGRATRTRESILLDPANWTRDEAQTVRVTVEVTDEQTGQKVSRAVGFTLPPNN